MIEDIVLLKMTNLEEVSGCSELQNIFKKSSQDFIKKYQMIVSASQIFIAIKEDMKMIDAINLRKVACHSINFKMFQTSILLI